MRYLLTGGGTGGHVTPALAIASELKKRDSQAEFLYVGVPGKAEELLVPKAGIPLSFVRSRGFPGMKNLPALLLFLFALSIGFFKALFILFKFRPKVIIATGGYVSAPILFAAAFLRRMRLLKPKIFIHESNLVPGRLNTMGAAFADRVGVFFPETLDRLPGGKGVYVGYPVRSAVSIGDLRDARRKLELPEDGKIVLAFGGSQGARTINRAVVDALPRLLADPKAIIIHGTGKQLAGNAYNGEADVAERLASLGDVTGLDARYIRKDFFHDIGTYYAAADLAVCRGGAGTVAEVAAAGLPSIIIPKANLPGDHQVGNARALEQAGAARILYEGIDLIAEDAVEFVSGETLAEAVLALVNDPPALARLAAASAGLSDPGCLGRIASHVEALAGTAGEPEAAAPVQRREKDRILGLDSNRLDLLLMQIKRGEAPPLGQDEDRLVRYKIDGYLSSENHVERARGCRMTGLANYAERAAVLATFATAGGEASAYRQSPFVRRDAFVGLGGLGIESERIISALEMGISDTYYEARAEAIKAIAAIACKASDITPFSPLLNPLLKQLDDRSFEVRAAAVSALGETATDASSLLPALRKHYFDIVWKVRAAIFDAMRRMIERGVMEAGDARLEMEQVLITSNGYLTQYPLKETYNRLRHQVAKYEGSG